MFVVASAEFAAGSAVVTVVVRIDITHADGSFQIPAFAQNPLVSVGDAETGGPPLITVILHVLFQKRNAHAADVVLTVTGMQAEKMAVETFVGVQ